MESKLNDWTYRASWPDADSGYFEIHYSTYLREMKANAWMEFTTPIQAYDTKRCHIFHAIHHGGEGYLAANL